MEIKEAVGILKGLQEPEAWEPQITEKTFEALDMAIMALEKFEDQSRFITIENNFLFCIMVDRVTGVMYAVSNGNSNAGTFTPLVNAEGTPLIYEKRMTITESDLVKMGVIDPGEIKAGQVGPIEKLKDLLEKAESEPPIIEGSVLEDLLVPVGLVKEIISVQPVANDTNVGNNSEIPNSSDAVSRQAAIDALDKRFDNIPMEQTAEILMLRKDLRELPTIQPEAKEGEWELKDHMWECNKCGCRINLKNPLDGNIWNYYFCPHCGTKMIIAVQRF